jgi:hypothetical protein
MFSNIKLTPFTMFLLLFVVFILAIFLQKWFPWVMPSQKEGYISFYGSTPVNQSPIIIPQYSSVNNLLKMFDNLFFDPVNGNVVVIDTTSQSNSSYSPSATDPSNNNEDMSASLINHINIYTRTNGTLVEYSIPANSVDLATNAKDTPNQIQCAYSPWTIKNPFTENTMIPWTLFYLPCGGDKTVIHILDDAGNLATYIAVNGNVYKHPTVDASTGVKQFFDMSGVFSSIGNKNSFTMDPVDNTLINVQSYSYQDNVYQLANSKFYDPNRSCLFSVDGGGAISQQYSVLNGTLPPTNLPVKPDVFQSYGTADTQYETYFVDSNLVILAVGVPTTKFTAIVVINKVNNQYTIQNYAYFKDGNVNNFINSLNQSGMCSSAPPTTPNTPPATSSQTTSTTTTTTSSTTTNTPTTTTTTTTAAPCAASMPWNARNGIWNDNTTIDLSINSLSNVISQWYLFHPNNASSNVYSKDYMLKTQMVPPVCPACPACPSASVCTNCGGKGGAGTNGVDKENDHIIDKIFDTTTKDVSNVAKGVTHLGEDVLDDTGKLVSGGANLVEKGVQGGANLVEKGVQGGANLVEKGVRGGANLVEKGVEGGANLVEKGVQGGVGLVEKGVGGTVNLVEQGVGGAVNLAERSASGIGNWLSNLGSSTAAAAGAASDNVKYTGQNQRNNYYSSPYTGGPYNTVPPQQYGPNVQNPYMNVPPVNNASPMSRTDPYSYYGAVPSKGSSQFMPITSDFSKFGR